MNCKKVQFLMCIYIADDRALTAKERSAFANHLQNCQECTREYEESKFVIDLAREHWQVSEDTLALIEKANKQVKPRMAVKEGWEDLKHRIPELAQLEKHQERLQLFHKVGAVAACLVIGVLIFLAFSYSTPKFAQESIPEQVVFAPKPSVKVELISDNSKVLTPSGHEIAAAKELKNLIINDKHRIVMNIDTTLTVEPLIEGNRLGCLVKLASGEILAHVEHDGNPFVVSTVHGKAAITGTTFDVKVTDNSTTLVVTEGTVQIESKKGIVKVAANQTSMIVAESAPAKPIYCNSAELTAWATNYETQDTLAQIEAVLETYDITAPPLFITPEPIDLESINHKHWIEQKRNWFKQQFPWIFQLKDALAEESIEVDYPELLIESGDVWQFVCLEVRTARFSAIDSNSLLRVASNYGFDKQWVLDNISAAKFAPEKSVLSENNFTGLRAFKQCLKYAKGEEKAPAPLFVYHSAKYLAETRSLIWFAVKDGKYDLTAEECAEVLFLLQEEVTAAYKCQNGELPPRDKLKLSCSEDKCQELIDSIVGYIETMQAIEERIAWYIIKINQCEKEISANENYR